MEAMNRLNRGTELVVEGVSIPLSGDLYRAIHRLRNRFGAPRPALRALIEETVKATLRATTGVAVPEVARGTPPIHTFEDVYVGVDPDAPQHWAPGEAEEPAPDSNDINDFMPPSDEPALEPPPRPVFPGHAHALPPHDPPKRGPGRPRKNPL